MGQDKAIGYVYDSMGNESSLERQKQKIEKFCQENGLELQKIHENTQLEGKRKHDSFKAFLEAQLERGTTVVIAQIDRIADKFDEIQELQGTIKDSDVKVISTKEDDIQYLQLTLGNGIVHTKGNEQKANRAPYGYELVDGKLVPKDEETDVVTWVFEKNLQYSENPPEVLLESAREYLKANCTKAEYEKLTEQDIKHQASLWVTAYMTLELNVRLGAYSECGLIQDGSTVKERLAAPLTEQEEQLIKSEVEKGRVRSGCDNIPKSNVYVGKIR